MGENRVMNSTPCQHEGGTCRVGNSLVGNGYELPFRIFIKHIFTNEKLEVEDNLVPDDRNSEMYRVNSSADAIYIHTGSIWTTQPLN